MSDNLIGVIWYRSSSGDDQHNDQEFDVGNGWWISLGDESTNSQRPRWTWEVHDHWLRDEEPGDPLCAGESPNEAAAKNSGLVAALAALPSYAKVEVTDGLTNMKMTYLTRDLPQIPLLSDGRRLTNLDLGTEFFIKWETPITRFRIIEFDGRG